MNRNAPRRRTGIANEFAERVYRSFLRWNFCLQLQMHCSV